MVILNCDVTLGDAKVVKEYVDEDYLEPFNNVELHTGVDIECETVYSASPGSVLLVNKSGQHYNVIVRCDRDNCYNYAHLQSVNVSVDDEIELSSVIGTADRFVHFEHLTAQQGRWPVRVGLNTWYKHNPMNVLKNGYQSTLSLVITDVGDDIDPDAAAIWEEPQIWAFDDTVGGVDE